MKIIKKNTKEKSKTEKKESWIFLVLICLSTLFMGIGYAQINPIVSEISGTLIAEAQDGIFITDVVYSANVSAEPINSTIISFHQTLLGSEIQL